MNEIRWHFKDAPDMSIAAFYDALRECCYERPYRGPHPDLARRAVRLHYAVASTKALEDNDLDVLRRDYRYKATLKGLRVQDVTQLQRRLMGPTRHAISVCELLCLCDAADL